MDLITLMALEVIGIESTKIMESIEQDSLYVVLGLAKGHDERSGSGYKEYSRNGKTSHSRFLRSVQLKGELASGKFKAKEILG